MALAILAEAARLPEILRKAAALRGPERDGLLARILILAGLRGIVGRVELELKHRSVIGIRKNPVLMRWSRELFEDEGIQERVEIKFGPVPKWEAHRLAHSRPALRVVWGGL